MNPEEERRATFLPKGLERWECDCPRCTERWNPLAAAFFGVSFVFALLAAAVGIAWAVHA